MQQSLRFDFSLAPIAPHRFQNGVETHLVAMLKAVGQCLLAAVDSYRKPVQLMRLDSCFVRSRAQPDDSNGRVLEPWWLAISGDGNPHLMRYLCGELMEGQCRYETNDSSGYFHCDCDKVWVPKRSKVGKSIETTSERFD
jgi:hypothetical protein